MSATESKFSLNSDLPLAEGQVVSGALFNEPMRVESVRQNGADSWVVGLFGVRTERFRKVTLTRKDIESLQVSHLIPTLRWRRPSHQSWHSGIFPRNRLRVRPVAQIASAQQAAIFQVKVPNYGAEVHSGIFHGLLF